MHSLAHEKKVLILEKDPNAESLIDEFDNLLREYQIAISNGYELCKSFDFQTIETQRLSKRIKELFDKLFKQ